MRGGHAGGAWACSMGSCACDVGVWRGKGGPGGAGVVRGIGWAHGPDDASHHESDSLLPLCISSFRCVSQRSEEDSSGTSEAGSQADEGPSTKRQKKALLCQVKDCGKVNKGGGFCKFVSRLFI